MSTSVKCCSYKNKSQKKFSDKCLDSLFKCYICKDYFKNRGYINHMNMHFNNPNLYLTCIMCNVNQHILGFRFKSFKGRLCVYMYRYRYTGTKERFNECSEKFNIKV